MLREFMKRQKIDTKLTNLFFRNSTIGINKNNKIRILMLNICFDYSLILKHDKHAIKACIETTNEHYEEL